MVRPNEIVEALLYTLKLSDDIPDSANYIGYEPDIDSESIKLPVVQITMLDKVDANRVNTELVDYVTDNDGNRVGRVYQMLYRQEYDVSIWTAHDSSYSARDLGDVIRTELYDHTTAGPEDPLIHPEDNERLDEVWKFDLLDSGHTNDLTTSPTLRRWTETVSVSACEQYITDADEPPIKTVNVREALQ